MRKGKHSTCSSCCRTEAIWSSVRSSNDTVPCGAAMSVIGFERGEMKRLKVAPRFVSQSRVQFDKRVYDIFAQQ